MKEELKDKYFVIYKDYTEYNQFEGSRDNEYESFDTLDEANNFIKHCERVIAGPLKYTQK